MISELVLTANHRLARVLKQEWALEIINTQNTQRRHVLISPHIFAWSEFFKNQTEVLKTKKTLSRFEASWLIKEILEKNWVSHELGLVNPEATAGSFYAAHENLWDWSLEKYLLPLKETDSFFHSPHSLHSPEFKIFFEVMQVFKKRCEILNVQTEAEFRAEISLKDFSIWGLESLENNKIYLLGFDDFSPRMKKILDQWRSHGLEIQQKLDNQNQNQNNIKILNKKFKIKASTPLEELILLAKMAQYFSSVESKSVGIIVPDLVSCRENLIEIFNQVLEPEIEYSKDPISQKFAVTGGVPLGQVPLIFELLQEIKKNIKNIKNREENGSDLFIWRDFFLASAKKFFENLELELSSYEHQAVSKFYDALDLFVSLGLILKSPDGKTVIAALESYLNQVFFQPESESTVKINIYGPLEAAGIKQDVLLLAHMNAHLFPERPSPNPYLPYGLQAEFNLPHATPQRELLFSEALIDQWLGQAALVIATYFDKELKGDFACQPSALIEPWPDYGLLDYQEENFKLKHNRPTAINFITLQDDFGPMVSEAERSLLKSGVDIFKTQAACPFQAFAKHRLGLKKPELKKENLNLQARGILTHKILEILMPKIMRSDQNWPEIKIDKFEKEIVESIQAGLNFLKTKSPEVYPEVYWEIEKLRLFELMQAWIMLEQQWVLDHKVQIKLLAHERDVFGAIGGIPISARVDRLDRLDFPEISEGRRQSGLLRIVDYKTGKIDIRDCMGDEHTAPDDPQMAIYSLLLEADCVTYAVVNLQSMKIENLEPDVKFYKTHWKHNLEKLADLFNAGWAKIQPKYGEKTCEYCDYLSLCRKNF